MKRFLTIFALASVVGVMAGCSKDSADSQPQVVDYVKISLIGENPLTLSLGDTFEEPGYTATDKGAEVTAKVQVTILDMDGIPVPSIETENPGLYTINYLAKSLDGVSSMASRTVYVIDPELEISLTGSFAVDFENTTCKSALATVGAIDYKSCTAYYNENGSSSNPPGYSVDKFDIIFTEVAPGIYDVNDLFGGWYHTVQGRGNYYIDAYGPSYATYWDMTGRVFLSADGTITLASSYIATWKDGVDYFVNARYDSENETIYWETMYGGSVGPMVINAKRK